MRQVLSADTLRIAKLRDPKVKKNPLDPPEFIQVTLDGIDTPRCERYIPTQKGANRKPDEDDGKGSPSKSPGKPAAPVMSKDDAFAYDAREFVRNKVMNKNVFYAIWRSDTNSNRTGSNTRNWGDVYYKEGDEMKSLTQELVAAGFAEVTTRRTDLSAKESKVLKEKQAAAQEAGIGKWNEAAAEASVRDMGWIPWNKQAEFGEQFLGKTLPGIVDGVISGSSLRMELCVDPKKRVFKNVVVNLAGVSAPRVPISANAASTYKGRRTENETQKKLERLFGEKAREWTEMRLLSQKVDVRILFTTSQQIIAQVLCAKGRIGPSLVKKGLAKYEHWSATEVDAEERRMLEESHKMAVAHKLNIWQFAEESQRRDGRMVKVTQVISGDTVEVLEPRGRKVRYTLSSIRAPRIGTRGGYRPRSNPSQRGQEEKEADGKQKKKGPPKKDEWSTAYGSPDQYLAREAKEFVRKLCIGQEVRLHYEYDRDMLPSGQRGQRPPQKKKFATIYVPTEQGDKNVALELIKMGYAELVLHAKNDSQRSMAYVQLEAASKKAQKEKKGVNRFLRYDKNRQMMMPDDDARKAAAQKMKITDYSGIDESNVATNKLVGLNQYLMNQRVPGIVEFVFGANRVKIYIPSKKACIAVRLAGIRVGNYTSNRSEDEVSKRAKEYLNNTILQREVEVLVTSANAGPSGGRGRGRRGRGRGRGGGNMGSRNPNLDGHILLKGVNVADYLLEHGMAQMIVNRYQGANLGGRRRKETENFMRLEEKAKASRIGVWKTRMEDDGLGDDSKREVAYAERSRTGQTVEVVVSHIVSATEFYVNDANSKQMTVVGEKLKELSKNPKVPEAKAIKGRNKVKFAAKYDGYYARCKVSNRDNRDRGDGANGKEDAQNWFVDFIDYGNRASVNRKQLAELPDDLRVDRIPPLAMKCVLTGLRVDPRGAAYVAAGNYLASLVFPESGERKMKMKIMYDNLYDRMWYVDLFVGDDSVNQLLAAEGFVTQIKPRNLPYCFSDEREYDTEWKAEHKKYCKDYFVDLRQSISEAKAQHKGVFVHGDIEDESDDNLGDAPSKR